MPAPAPCDIRGDRRTFRRRHEGVHPRVLAVDFVTGPVNIGNRTEFSMVELATMVIDLTGSHSCIVHRPRPEDDPRQRRPDISRVGTTRLEAAHYA
jgi:nucleoside-diphosphate-sugar epimerase